MIDLYMEAKRREQERLDEANVWRMLKSSRRTTASGQVRLRSQLSNWLGKQMVVFGVSLQTQCK